MSVPPIHGRSVGPASSATPSFVNRVSDLSAHLTALRAVDELVRSDLAFALVRLPGRKVRLVVQRDARERLFPGLDELESLDEEGFLLCPFAVGHGHPVAFIRADVVREGVDDVSEGIEALAATLPCRMGPAPHNEPDLKILQKRLSSSTPTSGYASALKVFLRDLSEGRFTKLVLSRAEDISGSFSAARVFAGACLAYPEACVSLAHGQAGTWIGASPEILLCADESSSDGTGPDLSAPYAPARPLPDGAPGPRLRTMALAGTRAAGTSGSWDEKNIHEQGIVADYIRDVLSPLTEDLEARGPRTVRAASVEHLRTDFFFRPAKGVPLARLARALHPTPAVCGLPKEEAMNRILSTESLDRRYYAGFLGWWSPVEPHLYVNLRCLKYHAGGVRLYAGGGILPESVLDSEWRETCHKMSTMLALLGR